MIVSNAKRKLANVPSMHDASCRHIGEIDQYSKLLPLVAPLGTFVLFLLRKKITALDSGFGAQQFLVLVSLTNVSTMHPIVLRSRDRYTRYCQTAP
jgi:hypothetical protein